MAKVTYTSQDIIANSLPDVEKYSSKDLNLIDNFKVNKEFDFNKHYIETHFYTVNNYRLYSSYNYSLPVPNLSIPTEDQKSTEIELKPAELAIQQGFARTKVKVLFHFLNDVFTIGNGKQDLYIHSISTDRKEVLLYSDKIKVNELINRTDELKEKIKSKSYFEELSLNMGDNDLLIVTNIDTFQLDNKYTVALRLYEPLPDKYDIKSDVQLVEKVSDSIATLVIPDIEEEERQAPKLRQANFSVELETQDSTPTEYFKLNDLFSYESNNSNKELFSLINEKSANIGIDHREYENFIHFSSAEERLRNFKYKVSLLEAYESDLLTEQGINNPNTVAASGSIVATRNLIDGIVNNFDHYERFLYYESGSKSWPKSNDDKPYVNLEISNTASVAWFDEQITSASSYDARNLDVLTGFLPEYIADDDNNKAAITFTHMLGQHYDNLWIYTKALTDKYDTDNRLDYGISKDLVQEAVKSMGIKLYNSVEGTNDLFSYIIQDTYDSGSQSEVINHYAGPFTEAEFASGFIRFRSDSNTADSNMTITLTSVQGTTITYQATNDVSKTSTIDAATGNTLFYIGNAGVYTGAVAREYRFNNAIKSSNGHGGEFTYESTSIAGEIVIKQTIAGPQGNIAWITGSSFYGAGQLSGGMSTAFTGGTTSTGKSISTKDYEASVYKRLYHNIPLLLKSKGTERGLRALINCFGIPKDFLTIKTFGQHEDSIYFGPENAYTSSLNSVTVIPSIPEDGKVLTGNRSITLENPQGNRQSTNIYKSRKVEVGFSPSTVLNKYINEQADLIRANYTQAQFSLDHWIGDPRDLNKDVYESPDYKFKYTLERLKYNIFPDLGKEYLNYNLKDFVRIFKFYDNVLFKMIKDFVPSNANLDVGIIIQPHSLERSKIKSPSVEGTDNTYSASIDTAFVTGSSAGAYNDKVLPENKHLKGLPVNFSPGKVGGHSDINFHINFATGSADFGEIVPQGTVFYHPDGTEYNIEEVYKPGNVIGVDPVIKDKFVGTPYEIHPTGSIASLHQDFYIMFSSESIDNRFPGNTSFDADIHHPNLVCIAYNLQNSSSRWSARFNDSSDYHSFDPLPNDVILSAFEQSGSIGVKKEIHKFYTPLNGFIIEEPTAAFVDITFKYSDYSPTQATTSLILTSNVLPLLTKHYVVRRSGTPGDIYSSQVGVIIPYSSSAATKALAFKEAIDSPNGQKFRFNLDIVTKFEEGDTLRISQKQLGTSGNIASNPSTLNSVMPTYMLNSNSYPIPNWSGGKNKSRTNIRHNATTFYNEEVKTISGSVTKNIADESPKYNGELSGSTITITDGELNVNNPFKYLSHPVTKFNITPVEQSSADVLESLFIMDSSNPTEYNTNIAACGAFTLISDAYQFYHDGTTSPPLANGSDKVYLDINGATVFAGNGTGYFYSTAIQTGNTVEKFAMEIETDGTILSITNCGTLDSTAPLAPSSAWYNSSITSNNVSAVPFRAYNCEVGTTMIVTASDESSNEAYSSLGVVNTSVFGSINCSTLSDGDDITLSVKLRDAVGNVSPESTVHTAAHHHGKVIPKQVAVPSGYSGYFAVKESAMLLLTQSINYTAAYKVQVHHSVDFNGTVSVIFDGNHTGATQRTATSTYISASSATPGTSSVFINDFASQDFSSPTYGNTVYGYVYLTDTFGNVGAYHTASVTHKPEYDYDWENATGAGTPPTYINLTGYAQTGSTYVRAKQNGGYVGNTDYEMQSLSPGNFLQAYNPYYSYLGNRTYGKGNSNVFTAIVTENSGTNTRYGAYRKKIVKDGYTYIMGPSQGWSQDELCVSMDTNILMKTGKQKLAEELQVGDIIRTQHEDTLEWFEDIIIRKEISSAEKETLEIEFEDGTVLIATPGHRVYIEEENKFIALRDIKVEQKASGKIIRSIKEGAKQKVVSLTVEKCRTYISNGILSHNTK